MSGETYSKIGGLCKAGVRNYQDLEPSEAVSIYLEIMDRGGDPRVTPWSEFFDKNCGYLVSNARLTRSSNRGQGNALGGGQGGKGNLQASNKRDREKKLRPNAPKKPKNDKDKICRSRSDADFGECNYKKCRFHHACQSCGEDHSAATCKKNGSWKGQ